MNHRSRSHLVLQPDLTVLRLELLIVDCEPILRLGSLLEDVIDDVPDAFSSVIVLLDNTTLCLEDQVLLTLSIFGPVGLSREICIVGIASSDEGGPRSAHVMSKGSVLDRSAGTKVGSG